MHNITKAILEGLPTSNMYADKGELIIFRDGDNSFLLVDNLWNKHFTKEALLKFLQRKYAFQASSVVDGLKMFDYIVITSDGTALSVPPIYSIPSETLLA